jgi:hypothetical protein
MRETQQKTRKQWASFTSRQTTALERRCRERGLYAAWAKVIGAFGLGAPPIRIVSILRSFNAVKACMITLLSFLILTGCRDDDAAQHSGKIHTQDTLNPEHTSSPPQSKKDDSTDNPPKLLLSEFLAANDSGLVDADGERTDWIELHNPNAFPLDLSDYALTQDRQLEFIWEFPALLIAPEAYLVVHASGKNRRFAGDELHVDFKLKADGEFLALIWKDPRQIVHAFGTRYPPQHNDVSYGISSNWNRDAFLQDYEGYFVSPTPGEPNSIVLEGFVENILISHEPGFMESPFELSLTTATPETTIRYTTDGSKPGPKHGTVYNGPVKVVQTSVFRIAAFKDGYDPSNIETRTFLFKKDVIRQMHEGRVPWLDVQNLQTKERPPQQLDPRDADAVMKGLDCLPVVSIVMDQQDLFEKEQGIYSNADQGGRAWERPCSIEYFSILNEEGFQVDCGMRVKSNLHHMEPPDRHSLSLFFRDYYGPTKLHYPLFGQTGPRVFDSLELRAPRTEPRSGNDTPIPPWNWGFSVEDLQRASGQMAPYGDSCHLFINGDYWGIYQAFERPEASFAMHYLEGAKEDFDVIKIDPTEDAPISAADGDTEAWERLWETITLGVESNEIYFGLQGMDLTGQEVPESEVLLDIDNLIDAMLVRIWINATEILATTLMPSPSTHKWYAIRNRNGKEGFRFVIRDAAHARLTSNLPPEKLTPLTEKDPLFLWKQCLANDEFKLRVADRIQTHCFDHGALTIPYLRKLLHQRVTQVEDAIVCETTRWSSTKGAPPVSSAKTETGDQHWRRMAELIHETTIPRHTRAMLTLLSAQGLYPEIAPPTAHMEDDGKMPHVTLAYARGSCIYTIDGSDPRLVGGQRSPVAHTYEKPIAVGAPSEAIRARVFLDNTWSALLVWDHADEKQKLISSSM